MNHTEKYAALIEAGKRSLESGERWCVYHPDGPLIDSASDDFGKSVRIVCDALKADWADLTEQGYRLGKVSG